MTFDSVNTLRYYATGTGHGRPPHLQRHGRPVAVLSMDVGHHVTGIHCLQLISVSMSCVFTGDRRLTKARTLYNNTYIMAYNETHGSTTEPGEFIAVNNSLEMIADQTLRRLGPHASGHTDESWVCEKYSNQIFVVMMILE